MEDAEPRAVSSDAGERRRASPAMTRDSGEVIYSEFGLEDKNRTKP